ncbi:MAG: acyltransferase [Bacteroidales bacterium]|nr:acyltransferase [Bacteroidales bacterium]
MESDKLTSKTIKFLRFPLACMVVYIHYVPMLFTSPTNVGEWCFDILASTLSHTLSSIAVPTFFLISGFLYFRKISEWNKTVYFTKTRSRFKTLIMPYIYWNIIYIVVYVLLEFTYHSPTLNEFLQTHLSWHALWDSSHWEGGLWCFGIFDSPCNTGPVLLQFWFFRNLIVIVLLSPIIYFLIRRLGKWLLAILIFCYLSNIWIQYSPLSITGFLFFCIGAYLSINQLDLVRTFMHFEKIVYTITSITFIVVLFSDIYNQPQLIAIVKPWFNLAGVISAICVASRIVAKWKCETMISLASTTFFIYATQNILIYDYSRTGINKVLGWVLCTDSVTFQTLHLVLTPIVTIVVCILLFYTLKRFTPRILGVLTGNRL